jgi:hypothetical protein
MLWMQNLWPKVNNHTYDLVTSFTELMLLMTVTEENDAVSTPSVLTVYIRDNDNLQANRTQQLGATKDPNGTVGTSTRGYRPSIDRKNDSVNVAIH